MKETKRQQEPGLAFWLMDPSDVAAELGGILGFELAVIDREHGTFDTANAVRMIALCQSRGLEVLTRVEASTRTAIQHALDFGSDGVILPQIRDGAHAREAAAYAKYPPLGTRGYGGGRTANYMPTPEGFLESENRRVRCFPMIETTGALEDVEAIAVLETVDGLFIGPGDLSLARGRGPYRAGDLDREDVRRVAAAAKAAEKSWAMPVASERDLKFTRELGVAFVTVADTRTAMREGLSRAIALYRPG